MAKVTHVRQPPYHVTLFVGLTLLIKFHMDWLRNRAKGFRPLKSHQIADDKGTKSNFLACMSNFSIQYNLSSASVAVALMADQFPEPKWAFYTLLGMVFAGAVLGMCVMGYLGDLIGRKRALIITLFLTVLGSAGCAIFPWGGDDAIYAVLTACRFILGVGVGGMYPLSAVTSSEGASANENAGHRVGWAFFWQTPGAMFPYVVGLILLQYHGAGESDLRFRVLMGIGAIPSILVLVAAFRHKENTAYKDHRTENPLRDIFQQRRYWRTLIGTAGTWFIYDVAYYGTNIFSPDIIDSIFGKQSLVDLCWHALVAQALGMIGCILAIYLLKKKSCYWLDLYGYILLSTLFGALAIVYLASSDGAKWTKFILYCILMLLLNFGPAVATYVLPTVCFPPHVRSTFHGISAACAKIGAVVGTFIFAPVRDAWGIAGVLWLQAALCVCGVLISFFFVDDDSKEEPAPASPTAGQFATPVLGRAEDEVL